MLKGRSNFLVLTTALQLVLSLWAIIYFNFLNRLSFNESLLYEETNLSILIHDLFTREWWALIILAVSLATIFSLVTLIYQDLKFQFMNICMWVIIFLLAIDINDDIMRSASAIILFIPVFALNIYSYFDQKKINETKPNKKIKPAV